MSRLVEICVAVLLPACVPAAQGGGAPDHIPPPPARRLAPRKALRPNPGKLMNPANPLLRLLRMPPEQRDRALEKLPPAQQARARQALANFDKLPPNVKVRRLRQIQVFAALPQREQQSLRMHINAFNQLPEDRRVVLRNELLRLHRMTVGERNTRLESQDFKNRYNPAEQELLADLAANYPFPDTPPPAQAER
jgi:hypothetical protein